MSPLMHRHCHRLLRASALAAALCVLVACGKDSAAPADGDEQQAAQPPQTAAPQEAVSSRISAMGVEQLRTAAGKALDEQRLYAPAGDNAMEYYAALRDKAPTDAAVSSALTDLMPYALIATEQSIAREDFTEAQRLYALMEKVDAQAPALPRLKQGIASAQEALTKRTAEAAANAEEEAQREVEREAELARQRAAEQQRAQQQAAQQLAQQPASAANPPSSTTQATRAPAQTGTEQAAAARRAEEQRVAEQRAAEQRAAEQRAAEQRATEQRAAQQAAAAPAANTTLRAISTPSPEFPVDALRQGRSGEVVVEFTVNPNGSVGDMRVVSANPPRVFDRAALGAVRRWRFQPISEPVTTRRTIGFSAN